MIEIRSTDDYESLVPFFIENELEFSEDEPVPTDIVKCWKVTSEGKLIGGFVLANRNDEFICDGIAVDEEYRNMELGRALLKLGTEETVMRGGQRIYLVARTPGFFRREGFETVEREEAPEFFECFTCPQYGNTCHPEVMKKDLQQIL